MHSLPQDRGGVPYVHDDCHSVYRPVNQSGVSALQVHCELGIAVLEPGRSQHTKRRLFLDLTKS